MLDPTQAESVLNADVANLIKQVKAGKPLTSSQRAIVNALAAGQDARTMPLNGQAKNKAELGRALGVSPQSLHRYFKMDGAPKPLPNQMHDVPAWQEFCRLKGIGPGDEADDDQRDVRLRLQNEKLREEIAILRREYLPRSLVEETLGVAFSAVRQRIIASGMSETERDDLLHELRQLGDTLGAGSPVADGAA